MTKIIRLFNTVKYLKSVQIYYRLYYVARAKLRKLRGFHYPLTMRSNSVHLTMQASISSVTSVEKKTFTFLNLSQPFTDGIDWNFSEFGKLWTYNLTYFDFLQQENMSKEEGLSLISDFIEQAEVLKDALEPFPLSLRGINWVKFLTTHNIKEQKIDDSLYAQYNILMDNLEYHLLGNHLLENGFSLLFAAYYFEDEKLYAKAKEILTTELEEQILEDGAHFELSPMYHQIMLFRILDCLNLVKHNAYKDQELRTLLQNKAQVMMGWLNVMTFKDGNIPLFNDSANRIAPTTEQLNTYAFLLNSKLKIEHSKLSKSGYRKVVKANYEIIVDTGSIGPDYIPGHAHADTFNFELYINPIQHSTSKIQNSMKVPFIVDTGLSTYETNDRRITERSSAAHNTVEVMETSSSEVWGGFRVANRAYVTKREVSDDKILSSHDGYVKKFDIIHTRTWNFEDAKIVIKDSLSKSANAMARLHFHPDVTEAMILERIKIQNSKFKIQNYSYAPEFNTLLEAKVLEIPFEKEITVEIGT